MFVGGSSKQKSHQKHKGWGLGVGEGDKGCSQKTGLGQEVSEPCVGGRRVRNACRCQVSQIYMKQADAEARTHKKGKARGKGLEQMVCGRG